MKEIKRYQAYDGTIFDNKRDCELYEKKETDEIITTLTKIKSICEMYSDCADCPSSTLKIIIQMNFLVNLMKYWD